MTLKTTLAAMARPLSLILEDKALLPEPLLAVALYDFEGETEMAELTFAKGQMLVSWHYVMDMVAITDSLCHSAYSAKTLGPAGV